MGSALDIKTLDACFGEAPDPVTVHDRAGRCIYSNASAEAMLGHPRSELWGRAWRELDLPRDTVAALEALRVRVIETGESSTTELGGTTPPDSAAPARCLEHRMSPMRDREGRVIAITMITREVSARTATPATRCAALPDTTPSLARTSDFHRLLEHAPALVAILRGPDHVYEFLNERFCETIPEARRLVGTSARRHRADLVEEHFLDLLDQVYESGEAYEAPEVPIVVQREQAEGKPLAETLYLTFVYQPIRSPDGSTEGIASFAFDVTESVLARKQIEEASRAKDDFLSTLSHELRTPLNAIVGWSHLLRTDALDEPQAQRALESIDRNAKVQKRLIDDLLDFARMVSGTLGLAESALDVASIVGIAVEAIRPSVEAKNVQLSISFEDRPVIVGDSDRLQQVVWNLLSNAAKFTGPRGRIEVIVRSLPGIAEIEVRDDGLGIDEPFLPHVFERFRQADSSMTRRHGGLGLGLAIARTLIEMHGGSIRAESQGLGLGTTMRVRLPRVLADVAVPAEHGREATSDVARLAGVRALVVDDEEDARRLVGTVLRRSGAEVRLVASAAEALEALHDDELDVLVSDIGMPDLDGIALIHRIRALPPPMCRIPAVAVTAYAGSDDRDRAFGAGYDGFLSKPLDVDELAVIVARAVGRVD